MADESSPRRRNLDLAIGVALALLLAPASFSLLALVSWLLVGWLGGPVNIHSDLFLAYLFIGITQLVYIVPAVLMARRRGRAGIAAGLILGAAVILAANIAFLYLLGGYRGPK